jgi:hypothetical protein
MIPFRTITGLKAAQAIGCDIQIKDGWKRGTLAAPTKFIHATNIDHGHVSSFGLSPEFAKEYLLDGEHRELGKMLFALRDGSSHAAIRKLWGSRKFRYRFVAPAGTEYYSTDGTLAKNQEVAFPYLIEPSDIEWRR